MKIKTDVLRRLRKEKGLTQVEFCKILKITQSTYSQYEIGARNPKFETVKKFADALEADWNDLCDDDAPKLMIDPSVDRFGAVCNCAVRYCLGRRSYMPSLVCGYIAPLLPEMTDNTLACFKRDIDERKRDGFSFGDACDYETWEQFYKAVCKEIERRGMDA